AGSVDLGFRRAGVEVGGHASSPCAAATVKWFHAAELFDTVEITNAGPEGFVVTALHLEKSGFGSFGSGCSGAGGVPRVTAIGEGRPRIGRPFEVEAQHLPPNGGVCLLAFGFSKTMLHPSTPLPFDLGVLGAPGCRILIDLAVVLRATHTGDSARFSVDLPPGGDCLGETFYVQALSLDPSANALGIATSPG